MTRIWAVPSREAPMGDSQVTVRWVAPSAEATLWTAKGPSVDTVFTTTAVFQERPASVLAYRVLRPAEVKVWLRVPSLPVVPRRVPLSPVVTGAPPLSR